MTSRVQKGGTIFRPIAKVKPRQNPTSRQHSTTPLDQVRPAGQSTSFVAPSLPESRRAERDADTIESGNKNTPTKSLKDTSSESLHEVLSRASTAPSAIKAVRSAPTLITVSQQRPLRRNASASTSPVPSATHSNDVRVRTAANNKSSRLTAGDSQPPAHLHIAEDSDHLDKALESSGESDKELSDSGIKRGKGSNPPGDLIKNNADGESLTKRKRKRSVPKVSEGPDDNSADENAKSKKARASSVGSRSRRSRGPSLPPYDPDADPGEEIDPTVVTMATLCEDTGQGRVSSRAAEILSNHATWKARNREKRVRMKALMEAKKYGRDDDEESQPKESSESDTGEGGAERELSNPASTKSVVDESGNGFDYSQDMQTSRFNVQVRIGPNGETIIDEESLVVDRVESDDTINYTHVTESDATKFVNSGTYSKRYRGSRWSAEETELFYNALSQYGENYELIAYVLPGRDRKSCKNKFKAEDKKNHARINYCLNNRIPVDMKTLSRMTGKDFSGPVPEIRPSTPTPIFVNATTTSTLDSEIEPPVQKETRKRRSKKETPDEVVIIGDIDTFEDI